MTALAQLALAAVLAGAALGSSASAVACSKEAPPSAPDSAPDEAALRADDKRELGRIVALDVRASQAMRAADDASQKGDAGAALATVTERASPAIAAATQAAEGATMKTDWGRAKKEELLGVLRDRRAEMPKYEDAVRTGDPEKMLASIQAQAAIERRALVVVAAVEAGR